jgi:hypothetical protein
MWPQASEINDDDEQDTARKREIEIRDQTSPARIIISPTTINHEHHHHEKCRR